MAIRHRLRAVLACLLLLAPLAARAQPRPMPTRTEIGKGIYLFSTPSYGDVGLDGNSVAIVSNEGVLVFDANGTPAAAAAVLAEIRTLTDRPVRYLIYSHWHWDHWYGAEIYRQAFPDLVVISHEKTRALMEGPAIEFNRPGLENQLPGHIQAVEDRLAEVRSATPTAPDVARLEEHLAQDRFFLEQKRNVQHVLADLTFSDSLTIHLGARVIHVLHHDRAITPGDAYLYLPNEKVVITGDLLINPITFALFCYPAGWIRTLREIDALDAAVVVPGHGAPMHDEVLLKATIDLLELETTLAGTARDKGQSEEEAEKAILADRGVIDLRTRITGGDSTLNDAFALYLVKWFTQRLFQEAAGPLDDSIPSMP